MASRADVVAQARTWVGTRWEHQGRLKGVGVDCAGLVIGVARELGLANVNFASYGRIPDGHSLVEVCAAHMQRIDPNAAELGDVLVIAFERDPQHLAILSKIDGRPALIHSFAEARGVVEHDFDSKWRSRVRGAFRMPGVS